jgi:TPR repeat protein
MDDAFNWYNEAAIRGYEDASMRLVELGFLDID